MSEQRPSLYAQVLEITSEYLGPAAPRFIDRQITHHLSKEPTDLVAGDMPVLINWTRGALALLTDNVKLVEDFADRLQALTDIEKVESAKIN